MSLNELFIGKKKLNELFIGKKNWAEAMLISKKMKAQRALLKDSLD